MSTSTNPVPARRGSLVGPIILVVLGALFLANNLRPELSLWDMAARYWPFLLIFWGAARLVEYVVGRASGRPIARTLTGGEVFLVVLICVAGNAMFGFARGDWQPLRITSRGLEWFGESHQFTFEQTREFPADATLVIENQQGNVRVMGMDTKELRIVGRKNIRALSRSRAERYDSDTPLEVREEKGRIYVRTNQDRLRRDSRISTDMEVTLPATASVAMEGRYGDWDVKDVAGPVTVNSNNAGVRLSNIAKDARVTLARSDIVRASQMKGGVEISGRGQEIELEKIAGAVSITGEYSGMIRLQELSKPLRFSSSRTQLSLEKLPGRMEMDSGMLALEEVVGPIKLNLTGRQRSGKDIRIEDFSKDLEITGGGSDVELRTTKLPLANIHADLRGGDIQLEVPGGAQFTIQAETAHGKVENDFGGAIKVEERGKSGAEMRGGSGGSQVRLVTGRGDITLKKAGAAPKKAGSEELGTIKKL